MASQTTDVSIVCLAVCWGADQRKHQKLSITFVTDDRWIPLTKGQKRGECFHLMTSSWYMYEGNMFKPTWFTRNVIFSCDQAAIWLVQSVVRLSVTPFSPCSYHYVIMKFSGVITMDRGDVHAKGLGQRSKVKATEVNTQLSRFRTLSPVWIHIWQWNHAHSLKQHRRGAPLFFKVIC